jgi:hypothetical protein
MVPFFLEVRLGMVPRSSIDASRASWTAASSGSPTNIPSTAGERRIDAAGVVDACGPKLKSGAP